MTFVENMKVPNVHLHHGEELAKKYELLAETLKYGQQLAKISCWLYEIPTEQVFWSEEIYNILDSEPNSLTEKQESFLPYVHPDDLEMVERARQNIVGAQEYDIEYRIITAKDQVKYVREKTKGILDENDTPIKVVGIIQDITEQKLRENSLVEAERIAKIGSWEIDIKNRKVLFCSEEIYRIYGISKGRTGIDNKMFLHYIHPEDRHLMEDIYKNPPQKQPFDIEFRVIRPDGSIFYAYNIMEITFDHEGKPVFMRGITQDVTEKRELEKKAQLKQEKINKIQRRFNALIKESGEVFEILGVDGKILYINEASERITGYKPEERLGKNIFEFYGEEEVIKLKTMLASVINFPKLKVKRDIIFKSKDGQEIVLEFSMQNFLHDPAIDGIVVNFRDITERVEAEQKIIQLSTHDQLTGLPNRIYFEQEIARLSLSAKEGNSGFGIFMLDIDSLEHIKDTLGYKVVQQYIFQIAIRLKGYCNGKKILCRYSDNRFIIICPRKQNMEEYEAFIKGLYALFTKPLKAGSYELDVDISIGISFYNDGESKDRLIRHAETALFLAKSEGKNQYKFYSSDLNIQSYKQFILRKDLRKAIEENQLKLYFQPMVSLRTSDILAAEVLLRWEHPEWGVVSPVEFISIAEETGCIIKIGRWLIREVCSIYKGWLDQGLPDIKIAINFSSMEFFAANFVENILATIAEFELNPNFLIMEITENVLIKNTDKVIADIKRLKSHGIQIALDDFGTGYSSLAYLNSFDIDILKIDGSFIRRINKDETSTIITRSIINMAQELKIKLVAEHIETWEQLNFLNDLRCYTGQGYLFSKPVPAEHFEWILSRRKCKPKIPCDVEIRDDRRKYFRIQFVQCLEADLSILEIKGRKVNVGNTKVLVKNIGPGGLCFISNIRLPVEKGIILQFRAFLLGREMRVYGYTVWSREIHENLFEYGVQFTFDENTRSDLVRELNKVQIKMKNDILFADGSFISGSPYGFFKTK